MNVRELKEMLSRFDEDLRVTIGGEEYEGGACRLDRNGRVSIELESKAQTLLARIRAAEADLKTANEEIEELEEENSKLEKELCQHEYRRERVQDAIQAMTDAIEALKP